MYATARKPDVSSPVGASGALSLFRFSLALMVMAVHLSPLVPPQSGRLAVEAFFCISGFLISMVATTRYEGRPIAFLANRFLRIYPTYWTCLAIAVVVVLALPSSTQLHPSLRLPDTGADWAANLAVFGLTQQTMSRLLPAAWSLHTELWFYFVIGLVTAGRPRLTLAMLAATLALSFYCAFGPSPFSFYGTPIGNADAFFIGSAVFMAREYLRPRHPLLVAGLGLAAFEILAWGPFVHSQTVNEFLGAPAAGLFLLGLWNADLDAVFGRWKAQCNLLGRLSYPLFLLHWPLGALAMGLTGFAPSAALLLLTFALSLAAAALVLWGVEEPLVRLRAAIRRPASGATLAMPAISD